MNQIYPPLCFFSAVAVHACLCGSLPSGGSDLPLSRVEPGDSIHLLPACLHHPALPEPHDLWFSWWAVQKVLDPIPILSEPQYDSGQASATEPTGELTTIREPQLNLTDSLLHTSSTFITAQFTLMIFALVWYLTWLDFRIFWIYQWWMDGVECFKPFERLLCWYLNIVPFYVKFLP